MICNSVQGIREEVVRIQLLIEVRLAAEMELRKVYNSELNNVKGL